MPSRYVSNGNRAPAYASGRFNPQSDAPAMRKDAFGDQPTPAPTAANPPPTPGNASPPPAQVNTAAPPPAQTPPPAPTAPAQQAKVPAQTPPPAPTAPAGLKAVEPHMPKVGNVTAANPTGDPKLNDDGTPKAGSNSDNPERDARRKALTETVINLGRTRGAGANSRGELAVAICQGARDGIISADKKSTDVADLYEAFTKAQSSAQIDDAHLERNPKNVATAVSKLALFAKLGAVDTKHDTAKLLARAREIIPKVKDSKMTAFDALRVVAKTQLAAFKTDPKAKPLTEPQIKALVAPDSNEDADEKSPAEFELSELEAIIKRAMKLQDGSGPDSDVYRPGCPSDELQRALAILGSRRATVAAIVKKEQGADETEGEADKAA